MVMLISSAFTTPYCSMTAVNSFVLLAIGAAGYGIWVGARKLYGRGMKRWEGTGDNHYELD